MIKLLAQSTLIGLKVLRRLKMLLLQRLFMTTGTNVIFDPRDIFSYQTISIGNDVFIGSGANFAASKSSITLGNKIMFGPNVTIMGGDHNFSVIGSYMFDTKEKKAGDDLPVTIDDDVWVGAGVIILKGVTIGRGSIIAAGAVVTSNIPPYSIAGGIPAKVIKQRFSHSEIINHESMLGLK